MDSLWVMRNMVFAVDVVRERDKPIFLVVFDDADIDKNLSWKFFAADCLWILVKSGDVD